jgi:hypothetical protein
MSVDANGLESADAFAANQNDSHTVNEEKLELIISSARDIAIVSEELLRDLISPVAYDGMTAGQYGATTTKAQAIALAPALLTTVHTQLQSLLVILQGR